MKGLIARPVLIASMWSHVVAVLGDKIEGIDPRAYPHYLNIVPRGYRPRRTLESHSYPDEGFRGTTSTLSSSCAWELPSYEEEEISISMV